MMPVPVLVLLMLVLKMSPSCWCLRLAFITADCIKNLSSIK